MDLITENAVLLLPTIREEKIITEKHLSVNPMSTWASHYDRTRYLSLAFQYFFSIVHSLFPLVQLKIKKSTLPSGRKSAKGERKGGTEGWGVGIWDVGVPLFSVGWLLSPYEFFTD